ncbi:MAG: hypothetical protein ACLFQP_00535 [Halothece sp.]
MSLSVSRINYLERKLELEGKKILHFIRIDEESEDGITYEFAYLEGDDPNPKIGMIIQHISGSGSTYVWAKDFENYLAERAEIQGQIALIKCILADEELTDDDKKIAIQLFMERLLSSHDKHLALRMLEWELAGN